MIVTTHGLDSSLLTSTDSVFIEGHFGAQSSQQEGQFTPQTALGLGSFFLLDCDSKTASKTFVSQVDSIHMAAQQAGQHLEFPPGFQFEAQQKRGRPKG